MMPSTSGLFLSIAFTLEIFSLVILNAYWQICLWIVKQSRFDFREVMADAETGAPGEPLSKNEQKRQQKVWSWIECVNIRTIPIKINKYTIPFLQLAKKAAEKAEKDKAKAEAAAANPDVKAKPKKVQFFLHSCFLTSFTAGGRRGDQPKRVL